MLTTFAHACIVAEAAQAAQGNLAAVESTQLAESERAAYDAVAGDPAASVLIAVARGFHQAGVPSDQLEELMHRVARAVGLELQVTVLPTSITAAIGPGWSQRLVLLRLEPGSIDLQRLALLNRLYDDVVAHRIAHAAALAEIDRIERLPLALQPAVQILAYGVMAGAAGILLGGRPHDIAAAGVVGIAAGVVAVIGRRVPTVARLFEVIAACLATLVVTAYGWAEHSISSYVPLVAGVVQLLPGLQLTAALHELACRNLVAGTARLGSVLITLLMLGCGFALGLGIVGSRAMHLAPIPYAPTPVWALAIAVAGIAAGIALLDHARKEDYVWVFASCALGEIAYRLLAALPEQHVASFGAAFIVGCCANAGVRFTRVPQALLLIPALLTLVPGSLSYESILFELQRDPGDGGAVALNSVVAAVELVAGILLAQLVFAPNPGGREAGMTGA